MTDRADEEGSDTTVEFRLPKDVTMSGAVLATCLLVPLDMMNVKAVAAAAPKLEGDEFGRFVFGMVAEAIQMIAAEITSKHDALHGEGEATMDQRPPGVTLQ